MSAILSHPSLRVLPVLRAPRGHKAWLAGLYASCLMLCGGMLGAASARAEVTPAQAEEVMKKSGLWDQLGSVLPQARVGFSAAFSLGESEPDSAAADRLNAVLEEAYGAERLRKLGLAIVARSLDAGQVAAMQRWFESPLGRKVGAVEQSAAGTQTDLREVIRQGTDMFERLPASRRELLTQLLTETRADEAMVDVSIRTLVATHKGVSTALPGGFHLTNAEVKATLMTDREQMRKAYADLIVASFAQAYTPLTDGELKRYVGFLRSPAGKRHTALALQSLHAALDDGEAHFVKGAPEALKALAAEQQAAAKAAGNAGADTGANTATNANGNTGAAKASGPSAMPAAP